MKLQLLNPSYVTFINKLLLIVLLSYVPASLADGVEDRLTRLEQQIQQLKDELTELQTKLNNQNYKLESLSNRQADNQEPADTGAPVTSPSMDSITYAHDIPPATSPPIATMVYEQDDGAPVTSVPIASVTYGQDSTPSAPDSNTDSDSVPLIPPNVPSPTVSTTDAIEEQPPTVSIDETAAKYDYQNALNQLKAGKYTDAIKAFRAFIKTYPESRYAGNAQYWLGEAFYVSRNFSAATLAFNKLLERYPANNKVAGGMLKLGYIHQENGQIAKATEILQQLIEKFPNSTEAKLAEKRLNTLAKAKS